MKKLFFGIIIGTLCFAALIAIYFILTGIFNSIISKLMVTVLIIFVAGCLGLFYANLYDKNKKSKVTIIRMYPQLIITGIILVAIGTILNILLTWEILKYSETLGKIELTIIIFNVCNIWIAGIIPKSEPIKIISFLKLLTIVAILVSGIFALIIVWINGGYSVDIFLSRMFWVFTIISLLGSFVITILNKI